MESNEEDDYWDDIPEDWQEGITREYTWWEITKMILSLFWIVPYILTFLIWDSIKTRYEKLRSML